MQSWRRRLRPERVTIVTEEPYAEGAPTASKAILIVLRDGFTPESDRGPAWADFVRAGMAIRSLAEDLIGQGFGVAIDITSGRKVTVAGALIAISLAEIHIQHIYYLAMQSLDDVAKPYMMIPHQIQRLRDLMEELEI